MNTAITFTPYEVIQIVLWLCGAVISISTATAIIIKIIHKAKQPDTERDEALKKHQQLLENDNKRLKELEDSNKIIMQSMLALMSHAIDGNHTEDLKIARDDLQKYLIRR